MSRLFYHVMQDNAGNLLFDVSGTMRLAGTGTLATIYGDEALTVILPNPMTNHPSFGSFKCFLGAGDYDFYLAKSGYTFETLSGLQGHGTMAQQDGNSVAITGGNAAFDAASVKPGGSLIVDTDTLMVDGVLSTVGVGMAPQTIEKFSVGGTSFFNGGVGIGGRPQTNNRLVIEYLKASTNGLQVHQTDNDTGPGPALVFTNVASAPVGSILTTATTTAYATTSDARLKHAITPLTGALDVIRALNPVSYLWNADDSPGRGLLAGDVQEVIPDGVITGERGAVDEAGGIVPQMIDYSKLVPFLVGAVQTLAARLAALEGATP